MRANQLFGIFSLEKLKKVIPPHRAPGVQGGAQMRGNQLFGIFSPEKLKKVISPNQLFGIFSPEKLKKVIPPHRGPGSRKEPRCGGISFSAPAPGSRGRCGFSAFSRALGVRGISFSAFSALKSSKR